MFLLGYWSTIGILKQFFEKIGIAQDFTISASLVHTLYETTVTFTIKKKSSGN